MNSLTMLQTAPILLLLLTAAGSLLIALQRTAQKPINHSGWRWCMAS